MNAPCLTPGNAMFPARGVTPFDGVPRLGVSNLEGGDLAPLFRCGPRPAEKRRQVAALQIFFLLDCSRQRGGIHGPGKPWGSPRVFAPPAAVRMNEETVRQNDDRQLIAAVVTGKPDAFAALYDRLSGPLYAMCLRMTGDAIEAEDILQEAFLVIWRRAASYDGTQSSVFSWAVHLTRCKAIDYLRARGRRLRVLVSGDPDTDGEGNGLPPALEMVAASGPGADDAADLRERAGQVRRVLGALPADQCQAIEMAFFSDLTHHEISARLGQPLGTIKARIRRGLLKLRDELRVGR